MDNQHRKISGYRELSQADIDLMNEIKLFGPLFETLINRIQTHLQDQRAAAIAAAFPDGDFNKAPLQPQELERLEQAEPLKWLMTGKMTLQQGLMEITRSVAQPSTF